MATSKNGYLLEIGNFVEEDDWREIMKMHTNYGGPMPVIGKITAINGTVLTVETNDTDEEGEKKKVNIDAKEVNRPKNSKSGGKRRKTKQRRSRKNAKKTNRKRR